MAGSNTEKPTGKAEQKKQAVVKTSKTTKVPVQETKKVKTETKQEVVSEKPVEEKKKIIAKKVKKDEVIVRGDSLHISKKYAIDLCRFIKNKPIEKAIDDLEQVLQFKKPVPMRGEIPHRKGKIMAGRFPQRSTEVFRMLLKSLLGNANNHDLEEPVISEASANTASRPYGRGGRMRRKRTHVLIKARSKKQLKKHQKKK